MWQSSSGCSCSYALRALGQHVTDSSFVEQGVNRRGRKATATSASAWADLWRDVWCEIDACGGLGGNLSVRKVKAHTTPEAVLAGVITPDDRAGNDLADAACKLVVLEHRAPPNFREAFGQLGRHTRGSLDCARWFCERAFGLDLDSWAWTSDYLQARASATLAPATASAPDHPETRTHVCRQRLRARLLALPALRAHDMW